VTKRYLKKGKIDTKNQKKTERIKYIYLVSHVGEMKGGNQKRGKCREEERKGSGGEREKALRLEQGEVDQE